MISELNDAQAKAVSMRDCSILVSAPAGSGKTKILVSRIISELKEGMSLDELLVLTFTDPAANEMKQRLSQALDKEINNVSDTKTYQHLLKQKELLPDAFITNFHSFCSLLLKQYGYHLDLNLKFDILSDNKVVQAEILDQCIEQWCKEEDFKKYIPLYFPKYDFKNLKSLILRFAGYMHTIYNFDQYYDDIVEKVYNGKSELLDQEIIKQLKRELVNYRNTLSELVQIAEECGNDSFTQNKAVSGKSASYLSPFDSYFRFFLDAEKALDNHEFIIPEKEKSSNMSWKGLDVDTNLRTKFDNTKKKLDNYKKKFNDIVLEEEYFKDIKDISLEFINYIKSLTERFIAEYQKYKKENLLLDFNDLESYTLELLKPKYGISKRLHDQLKEIMVDEYQDTNEIQETLIQSIACYDEPKVNLFMVGDMKQSIYRFREADPSIFKRKYNTFSRTDEEAKITGTRRIDLGYNYRSNKIVLDSVNYIFDQVMDESIGGLEYYRDESAQLNYDYVRKECKNEEDIPTNVPAAKERLANEDRFDTEILLYEGESSTGEEARMVATRINELVGHMALDDYRVGKRLCEYRDIVILTRTSNEFPLFKTEFKKFNIPSKVVLSKGLLDSNEIKTCFQTLKAIDFPEDDIAMTTMLTSPFTFSNFSENELMSFRNKEESIYSNLLQSNDAKVKTFLEHHQAYVEYSKDHSVYKVLEKILKDSGYLKYLALLEDGTQKVNNVDLFIENLKADENVILHNLVVKYDQSYATGNDSDPANVTSSEDNVVSFMTIHKSKGLEFPIVFLSNMHRDFNLQDSRSSFVLDKDLGFAIAPRKRIDLEEYKDVIVEYENPYRKVIGAKTNKETIDEEMRLYYVALTRASQKLILTGALEDDIKEYMYKVIYNSADSMAGGTTDHVLLYNGARNYKNYLSWTLVSLLRNPRVLDQLDAIYQDNQEMHDLIGSLRIAAIKFPLETKENTEFAKFTVRLFNDDDLSYPARVSVEETVANHIYRDTVFHQENKDKSIAVTRIIEDGDRSFKDLKYDDEMDDAEITAGDRGTIIHSFMEYIPLVKNPDLDKVLELFNDKDQKIIKEYLPSIKKFLTSDVFKLMLESKKVYKEKNFTLKENDLLIHGIFDVLCLNDDLITIIDYKTDRLISATQDQLEQLHKPQMDYYKEVIEKTYHIKARAIVYYLYIDEYVII